MTEEWKAVPGYDGYEASTLGRVRSLNRVVPYERIDQYSGRTLLINRYLKGRILRPYAKKSGHLMVLLGRGKSIDVHVLVLLAFVGGRPDGMECRHLDGNPGNNRLENLRWGTRSENNLDAVRHGTRGGERHCASKLTHEQANHIRRETNRSDAPWGTITALAQKYGVSVSTISQVKYGRSWRQPIG